MDVPKFPPPPPTPTNISAAATNDPQLPSLDERDVSRWSRYSKLPPPSPVRRETPTSRRRRRKDRARFSTRGSRYRHVVRNLVHPRERITRRRVTELHLKMTERRGLNGTPSVDFSPKSECSANGNREDRQRSEELSARSVAVQTQPIVPYRLRMLPSFENGFDTYEDRKESSGVTRGFRFCGRFAFSQFGLVWLLTFWAMAGAAAFYHTEGPREREQVSELATMQKELIVSLSTELRQMNVVEPAWSNAIQRYMVKHEKLLLAAVSSGYGEGGGGGGQIWTFPGCFLFAVSLLTTLGFGAPVPRTTAGRTVAVIFAAIGIPAHFLLILNVGIYLAVRLQNFATRRKKKNYEAGDAAASDATTMPCWVKLTPFGFIGGYYLLGVMCFGVARIRPVEASLLFPLDFTAAGGLATTSSLARTAYAIYLEGAVTIAALAVAVLQVSATEGLTSLGLKYDLLTNT